MDKRSWTEDGLIIAGDEKLFFLRCVSSEQGGAEP